MLFRSLPVAQPTVSRALKGNANQYGSCNLTDTNLEVTYATMNLFQPVGGNPSMSEDQISYTQIPRDESGVSSEWRSAAVPVVSSAAESRRSSLLRSLRRLQQAIKSNIKKSVLHKIHKFM